MTIEVLSTDIVESVEPLPSGYRPTVVEGNVRRARIRGQLAAALRRRAVPCALAAVVVALGLLFTFLWDPVVHHSPTWVDQSDLWGVFRGAHYVVWGDLGGVYNPETGIVSFPGMAVLLAPVAFLCDWLHLTSSVWVWALPRPTAELVLMPVEMVLASTVLFGADALAEELEVTRRRRVALCLAVGVLCWPVAAVWGHAEDALTMTFALYAMRAVLRRNWVRAGWLFGLGVVFQPLVLLVVPLFLAASPRGGRALFAVRCTVVSAFLVGVAFLGNPSGAYRALVEQPTPAQVNHATPWARLAPHVHQAATPAGSGWLTFQHTVGAFRAVTHAARPATPEIAGGPGRTVYVVLALLLALYVWRRPQRPERLLWLAGLVLAGRCFFEAVMTPYYLAPPLILLLVLAALAGPRRLAAATSVSFAVSLYAYWELGPWVWWLPIVAGLTLVLVLTYPPEARDPSTGTVRRVDRPASGVSGRPTEELVPV